MALKRRIEEAELEGKLLNEYKVEVDFCDRKGQSTQHIGDEWMRRKIREICGYTVSDRWIKQFRKRNNIRYFSGRRHTDQHSPTVIVGPDETVNQVPLRERRVPRTTSRREYNDVDARVADEIRRRHAAGERLTNPWIREFAQKIARELYATEADEIVSFFDVNWLYRFKRRYSVDLKPQSTIESTPREVHKPIPLYFNYHFYTQVLLMNILNPQNVILPQTVINE